MSKSKLRSWNYEGKNPNHGRVSLISLETALNEIEKQEHDFSSIERFTCEFKNEIAPQERLKGLALAQGFKAYRRRLNECNPTKK